MDIATSLFVPNETRLTPEQMAALREFGRTHGFPHVVDTGRGVTMTDFDKAHLPDPARRAALEEAMKGSEGVPDIPSVLQEILPGSGKPRLVRVDSRYVNLVKYWQAPENSGALVEHLERLLTDPSLPGLLDRLDADPRMRQAAVNRLQMWSEMAGEGHQVRQDLMNAMEIVGNEGLKGLFAARRAGAALPALGAGALLLPWLLEQERQAPDRPAARGGT